MSVSPEIFNGFFTVVSTTGDHRTFRVRTLIQKGGKKQENPPRFLGLLVGSDNTKDYKDFAIINKDRVYPFKKFKTPDGKSQFEVLARMFEDLNRAESQYIKKGFTIEASKHCLVCNRILTEKSSLISGIGPVCQGK
jgi:hypothetical protein